MQRVKQNEACELARSACAILRQHSRTNDMPPASLATLHATLRQLLPALSVLLSYEECEQHAAVYRVVARALRQIVEFAVSDGDAATSICCCSDSARGGGPVSGGGAAGGCEAEPEGGVSSSSATACTDNDDTQVIATVVAPTIKQVEWGTIHGCVEAITALKQALILPRRFPELFTGSRRRWQCILLYGPPGTGKTLLAQAASAESGSVLYSVSAADLLSKWVGESERQVRHLFTQAAAVTSEGGGGGGAVIFLDEIDALCGRRGANGETEAARRVKTEVLLQLNAPSPHITVLAATNLPWELDPALRRRFDRLIYVGLPACAERRAIVVEQLQHIAHSLSEAQILQVAGAMEGYSASDVVRVSTHAIMAPLETLVDADAFRLATKAERVSLASNSYPKVMKRPKQQVEAERAGTETRVVGATHQLCSSSRSTSVSNSSRSLASSRLATAAVSASSPTLSFAEDMPKNARNVIVLRRSMRKRSRRNDLHRSLDESRSTVESAVPLQKVVYVPPLTSKHSNMDIFHSEKNENSQDEEKRDGDTEHMYYVPCSSSHPGALSHLSIACMKKGQVLLPCVTYADFMLAVRAAAPSSSPDEVHRFEEWKRQGK